MHILQTRKINLEVNAVTDQLLTIMQQEVKWTRWPSGPHSACRRVKTQEAEALHAAEENATDMAGAS